MIGHKGSLNKFKKIEIISSIFSDHKGLKLETNPKGKNPKHLKSWRLTSMLFSLHDFECFGVFSFGVGV